MRGPRQSQNEHANGKIDQLKCHGRAGDNAKHCAADDGACRSVQSGQGYVTVLDRDEQWTYVLQPLGPHWQISPPDRHSAGHVFCADCASTSTGAGGAFLWFGASPQSSAVKRPLTALERSERRTELIAGWALHRNQLETRDVREAVSFGPLS